MTSRGWLQVTQLKRELMRSRDAAFNELEMRNKFLTEKLEELEGHLRQRTRSDTANKNANSSVVRTPLLLPPFFKL